MKWLIVPTASLLALTACGEATEEPLTIPAESGSSDSIQAEAAGGSVDFGDDSSEWANDGECDDPRFSGAGMTITPLLDDDIMHDATDCRTAFEAGTLQLSDTAAAEAAPSEK